NLVINGQYVPRKGYYDFKVEQNHVLVCDLRLLFNDAEWLRLNALFLEHEWNQVQVPYEASLGVTLSEWGVYVYKQGTMNLEEHVQFICPDPTRYSNIANIIVPPKDALKMMMEKLVSDEMFNEVSAVIKDMENRIEDKLQTNLTRSYDDKDKDEPHKDELHLRTNFLGESEFGFWVEQYLIRLYLLPRRILDYQGSLPLGTSG
ncbi:TMV resistance protein N-like, partial [Trifolium medium]|nr:TMV resistance protein N-like [Trifolium medium]